MADIDRRTGNSRTPGDWHTRIRTDCAPGDRGTPRPRPIPPD